MFSVSISCILLQGNERSFMLWTMFWWTIFSWRRSYLSLAGFTINYAWWKSKLSISIKFHLFFFCSCEHANQLSTETTNKQKVRGFARKIGCALCSFSGKRYLSFLITHPIHSSIMCNEHENYFEAELSSDSGNFHKFHLVQAPPCYAVQYLILL